MTHVSFVTFGVEVGAGSLLSSRVERKSLVTASNSLATLALMSLETLLMSLLAPALTSLATLAR